MACKIVTIPPTIIERLTKLLAEWASMLLPSKFTIIAGKISEIKRMKTCCSPSARVTPSGGRSFSPYKRFAGFLGSVIVFISHIARLGHVKPCIVYDISVMNSRRSDRDIVFKP